MLAEGGIGVKRKINWKNVAERALWTFAEGFLSGLALEKVFSVSQGCNTRAVIVMVLTGAVASGAAALKTMMGEFFSAGRKSAEQVLPESSAGSDDGQGQ